MNPYLIFSGGKINGKNNPPLSSVMRDYAIRKYSIPSEKIFLEDESIDTTENAEFSLRIARKKRIKDLSVLTNHYQLQRARDCFLLYGADPVMYSAEDILTKKSKRYARVVSDFKWSPINFKLGFYNRLFDVLLHVAGPEFFRKHIHQKIDSGEGHPGNKI